MTRANQGFVGKAPGVSTGNAMTEWRRMSVTCPNCYTLTAAHSGSCGYCGRILPEAMFAEREKGGGNE